MCSKRGLDKHFEVSCSICHSFTCEKAGQCSLRAGTAIILCFFRNKQEIRKTLVLNGLVLTSNWNTTVNELLIISSIFLGSCYYLACRQQSNSLKEVILNNYQKQQTDNKCTLQCICPFPSFHDPTFLPIFSFQISTEVFLGSPSKLWSRNIISINLYATLR